jgi:glutamine synthetase
VGDGLAAAEAGAKALVQAIAKKDAAAALATMADLRKTVDALEGEVADDKWPLPKYREMLFVY